MQRKGLGTLLAAGVLLVAPLMLPPLEAATATASRPRAAVPPVLNRSGAPAQPQTDLPTPCRAGLIALTFDDGPSRTVTPTLVQILLDRRVPATFFMVGSRVATAPGVARLVQRSGFVIGNHTWSHRPLTTLSDPAIRHELRSTRREFRAEGIVPTTLMRPPYGDINRRVRRDVRGLDLVPVLWTIDSRDWAGGSARQIAGTILAHLRRHASNIVLQHDGVANSPASVRAVRFVVREARSRGYCFTHLGPRGGMAPIDSTTHRAATRSAVAPVVREPSPWWTRPTLELPGFFSGR